MLVKLKIRFNKQNMNTLMILFVFPALLWEMIKLKVRETLLHYAKQRKKKRAHQEDELENTTATLKRNLEDKNIGEQQRELLDLQKSKKEKQEKIIEYRTKGAKITV